MGSQSAAWDASDVDWSAPPTAMSPSGEASSSGRLSGGASINDRPSLSIVSTSNAIESGEMVRRFVVQLEVGERRWEITRRYSDFFELERRLAAAFGSAAMPEFPPRLLRNSDDDIADRMVLLDRWVRELTPPMLEHRWCAPSSAAAAAVGERVVAVHLPLVAGPVDMKFGEKNAIFRA